MGTLTEAVKKGLLRGKEKSIVQLVNDAIFAEEDPRQYSRWQL